MSHQLVEELEARFFGVMFGRTFDDTCIQIMFSGNEDGDILAFLLERGETKVVIDKCRAVHYHLLFQFTEVWHSIDWLIDDLKGYLEKCARAGVTFKSVRVMKINNIRWILGSKEEFGWLKKVFPKLNKIEYVDNDTDDLEVEAIGSDPLVSLEDTRTYLEELGIEADTFEW